MAQLIKEFKQALASDLNHGIILIHLLQEFLQLTKLKTLLELLSVKHIELEEVKSATVFSRVERKFMGEVKVLVLRIALQNLLSNSFWKDNVFSIENCAL